MSFEFDAKQYERASTHQKEWGNRLIEELELSGTERILDLGCGDGALTAELARRVPEGSVLGMDASAAMIERARQRALPHLAFARQDINALDFDGEYDVVFSNAALHWVKDHVRLLANVYRALRPGGIARFNFGGDGNCRYLLAVLREVMAQPEFRRHFVFFDLPWFMPTVDAYRDLLAQSPFREAKVWEENADRFFPDAQAITQWIDQPSLVPFLPSVASEDRQDFRDAVVEKMLAVTRQPDGTYFETFRRINVLARA